MCPLAELRDFDHCRYVCACAHEADLLENRSPTLGLAKTSQWTTRTTSAGLHRREKKGVEEQDPGGDEDMPSFRAWPVLQMKERKKDRARQMMFLIGSII